MATKDTKTGPRSADRSPAAGAPPVDSNPPAGDRPVDQQDARFAAAIKAALAGDAAAYRELLTDLRPLLVAYVSRALLRLGKFEASTVEDLVQEILIAVHQKRHTFDQSRPFLPWLFAIARYKVIDQARRARKHLGTPLHEVEELLATPVFADPLAASDLAKIMESLPAKSRQVLQLAKLDGLSVAETAAIVQMSPVAVKVSIHRSLAALRTRFAKGEGR